MSSPNPDLPIPCADTDVPGSFEDLAASRRRWIEDVLHPWCQQATLKQLRQAEVEWLDIAGRVDVNATLWTWAWERFPQLTHPELPGVNETHVVQVQVHHGSTMEGFPDSRKSTRGMLVLVGRNEDSEATELGPFSIDDIASVKQVPGG